MDISGSKTEKNLINAFEGESQARNRYLLSGDKAKLAGLNDVADVFYELAANEGEHAAQEFEFLGGLGDLRSIIEKAAKMEHLEHKNIYPAHARTAREEGYTEIADFFDRMAEVEGTHAQRFQDLLKSMDGIQDFNGRAVLRSATSMAQVTLPDQANLAGFVHGGELMKLIDNAAGVAAARHSQKNIVLARVAEISFVESVRVGSLVIVNAKLTYVSHSMMEVIVELDTESPRSGRSARAVNAILIMVAVDKDGSPVEVAPLLISTEEQQELFEQGKARHEEYKRSKKKAKEFAESH